MSVRVLLAVKEIQGFSKHGHGYIYHGHGDIYHGHGFFIMDFMNLFIMDLFIINVI